MNTRHYNRTLSVFLLKVGGSFVAVFFVIQIFGQDVAMAYDLNRRLSNRSGLIPVGYSISNSYTSAYEQTKQALDAQYDPANNIFSKMQKGLDLLIDKFNQKKKIDSDSVREEKRPVAAPVNAASANEKLPLVAAKADKKAPVLSKVKVTKIANTTATVTWTTNENATSQIKYGLTAKYGNITTVDTTLVKTHSVVLTDLKANTTYHYRILSKDAAGNLVTSKDYKFKTANKDVTPPAFLSVSVSSVSYTTATVNWKTNEKSSSQIEYGTAVDATGKPLYGNTTTLNNALVTDHSQSLQNLTASTTYHYRIKSKDAAGNVAVSQDYLLVTANDLIKDVALASLVAVKMADGQLSRTDMISVFRQVEADKTVSAAEFTDLQTLQNSSTLFVQPDYVHALSGSVVANLAAGLSDTQLEGYVGKWFLGTDHPATPYSYQQASGSLFVGDLSYDDVNQGYIGDCYFIASLAEIALRAPSAITDAFIDNGDDTYTVRYFKNGAANYMTVDSQLPVDDFGRLIYDGMGYYPDSSGLELWAPLLEKAFATFRYGTNSYDSIDHGGWMSEGYEALLNNEGTTTSVKTLGFNALVDDWNAGQLLCVSSLSSPASSDVVKNHAYSVVGYDAITRKFTFANPWGSDYDLLSLDWNGIKANFGYVTSVPV